MRRLWLALGSILTVVVLAAGSFSMVNALAREDIEVRDVVAAGRIDEIVVSTPNGTVEVVGDPGATDVLVEATVSHGLRRTDYSVSERAGRLYVDTDCNHLASFWCRADITITTPPRMALDIRSSNGTIDVTDIDAGVLARTSNGSIDLLGVSGDVDVSSSNGAIRGHGLAGTSLSARTSNGRIELTFSEPPGDVAASTSNGSVEVTVPDDETAYAVDAEGSRNSSTRITVRTDPTSDHRIAASTSNGSISVLYPTS